MELVEHFVEGMVHVSTMADDYYRFIERAHVLRGENTGRIYRLGDQVRVQVIKVDMERRQIDLGFVEILERCGRRSATAARARAAPSPRQDREHRVGKREQRPGKRERQRTKSRPEDAGAA